MAQSTQKTTRAHGWALPNPVPVAGAGLVGYSSYGGWQGGGSTDVISSQFSASSGDGIVAPAVDAGGAGGGASAGDTAVA